MLLGTLPEFLVDDSRSAPLLKLLKTKMVRPINAKKSLGQNFLTDRSYIERIIGAAGLGAESVVLEIGPGTGALTEALMQTGARVIAIELDSNLVPYLEREFSSYPRFTVVEENAAEADLESILTRAGIDEGCEVTVVANLPYYISTVVLQALSRQRHLFKELILMFQKEVVDRITAKPGNSDRGYLTVLTEASFETKKLFDVPPTAFKPVPKVISSVLYLKPKPMGLGDEPGFTDLVSKALIHKRKTIANNLKGSFPLLPEALERSGIDGGRRAETLSLDEWYLLFSLL